MRHRSKTTSWLLLAVLLFSACNPAARMPPPHEVIAHPAGSLYVGAQVSFEVLLPDDDQAPPGMLTIRLGDQVLGQAGFGPYGIEGRVQATLWWAWDTSWLEPGVYTLDFQVEGGESWQERYRLRPAEDVPPPEPEAHWDEADSTCCTVSYITGTAAERDLETLLAMVDEQADSVEGVMQAEFGDRVAVVFLPRLLGQGGFATNTIYVSYLDENYSAGLTEMVLHHELVHVLDARLGGEYRPSILVEGLAVYASGGHYRPEALGPRAAALLESGWYLPLATLADDFYRQQHEVGYIEAGALVEYLVGTYGWEAYEDFYRGIPAPADEPPSAVLDRALQDHFETTLAGLEEDFLASLRRQPVTDEVRADVRLTIELYDAMRQYQALFDPSAYYRTAWLPDGPTMQQRGIVADTLRHPDGWRNDLLESLLGDASRALQDGDYAHVERDLWWIEQWIEFLN